VPPRSPYVSFLYHHLQSDRFHGNKAKMAKALGITPKHLSRGLDGHTTFSLELNLRIAQVLDEDAGYVLRLANWATANALIESLYGRAKLSAALEHFFENLRSLSAHSRQEVLDTVEAWAALMQHAKKGHP
jgi:plasmid maintenance system antidote protein VapI